MALDKYVEQEFPIICRGRDSKGKKVLETPVHVRVIISQFYGCVETISSTVDCIHNTGGHGQGCKASHPNIDKVDEDVGCPYSFDIPYALKKKK